MSILPTTRSLAATLLLSVGMAVAANTKTTVSQVTNTVDVNGDIDYIVTGTSPFGDGGVVNITNIDHAVLILNKVKPSAAIGLLNGHVKISGETAANGVNCQVKIYNQGAIIMPYAADIRPLTVYSEQNFGGEACSDFGLEDSGGFMNTLTDAKLNNRIRSFKLKRGYMVTFSLRPGGYGYSRCFIAADKDLEVASLPTILDRRISSYRVFKWNDTSKSGLANNMTASDVLKVGSTWCYTYNIAWNISPDIETVSHHIHEYWPGIGECGNGGVSPMMKSNNEPANSADENPATVADVLGNWERMMATGKRLCCPSSHDGGETWMAEFMKAIDERGWRCDIIDCHGYWYQNLDWWKWKVSTFKTYGRPIWITEMNYGASWSGNWFGGDTSGSSSNQQKLYNAMKPVIDYLNSDDQVERYAWWNNEADCSKILIGGNLTTFGAYYAQMNTGVAYNGKYDYVPKTPPTSAPTKLSAYYYEDAGKAVLKWKDTNGELSSNIDVERSEDGGSSWSKVGSVVVNDVSSTYSYEDVGAPVSCHYRIHVTDINSKDLYSETVKVASSQQVYLYNVGARMWLTSGNDWGTRATFTSHGGHDVILSKTGEGKYAIETQIQRDDNNHFLKKVDNTAYVDQNASDWNVTTLPATVGGKKTYLLQMDGAYMAFDGKNQTVVMGNETDENAQWLFQTTDDRLEMLQQATPKNPIDATFLLPGANFHQYDLRNENWQGSPAIGGRNINLCAEKYNTTFDVYQTVTGAPAGNYKLLAQGFYRNGNYADAAAKHNDGSESLIAVLYANDESQPLTSIFTEAGTVPATLEENNGKYPNTMTDASNAFTDNKYQNELTFSLAEGEVLRIGIRKTEAVGNDWTIFDNFRLIYLGDETTTTVTPQSAEGRSWATFYSSVANYQMPDGATAYTATVEDDELVLHKLGNVIPKDCAVIIACDNNEQLCFSSTENEVDAMYADNVNQNDLSGSDTETRLKDYSGFVYVMGASDEGSNFGFHRYTGFELPAGKAFLVMPSSVRSLAIRFEDELTGIHSTEAGNSHSADVYNLQGHRVARPGHGLYVKDGNKVVIK